MPWLSERAWAWILRSESITAEELWRIGATAVSRNELTAAVEAWDRVAQRFGTAPELESRQWVARALSNKGVTLGELGRSEEAIAVYDELERRFGGATEPALR